MKFDKGDVIEQRDETAAYRCGLRVLSGTLEDFRLTFHSFGQQYSTIDGQAYITWFNFLNPALKGLRPGCRVEYEMRPAPTKLCSSPHVSEDVPCATLLRVVPEGGLT